MTNEDTLRHISKFQALFGHYDNSIVTLNDGRVQVESIDGCGRISHPVVEEHLAEEISEAEQRTTEHSHRRARQFDQLADGGTDVSSDETDNGEMLGSFLGTDEDETEPAIETVSDSAATDGHAHGHYEVPPGSIQLMEVGPDTRIQAQLYPQSFRCDRCDHYQFLNPSTSRSLMCPDPGCGGTLKQYSFVFVCPRCSQTEHIRPMDASINEETHVGEVPCPNCPDGHLHLHDAQSMGTAQFTCVNCSYSEQVRGYCSSCHIPSDEDGEGGEPSMMKPTPLDASRLSVPLTRSFLFLGEERISLPALHEFHDQTNDQYSWELSDLSEADRKLIPEYLGVSDVFTVPNIQSLTTVYGYQTKVTAEGTDISEGERLARTFDYGDTGKKAYVAKTDGRGLVFDFDIEWVLDAVRDIAGEADADTYAELAAQELAVLNDAPITDILEADHNLVLVPLLHALQHVLFDVAQNQIGLDDILGSKLLVEDGAIVLYETENVGSGGLVQLTLDDDGRTLKQVIRQAVEQLDGCSQRCSSGCPSCVYIDDHDCRPFLPAEVDRWLPSNALLDRTTAGQFVRQ